MSTATLKNAGSLDKMSGIEHKVWVQVGDGAKVYATANEDLQRSNEKAAAVHLCVSN